MIVRPDLARLISRGKKSQIRIPVTRIPADDRTGLEVEAPCRFRRGRTYSIQPGARRAICQIEILEVRRQVLGDLTYKDAVAEGFKSRKEFWEFWTDRMIKREVLDHLTMAQIRERGYKSRAEYWEKEQHRHTIDYLQRVDVLIFERVADPVRLLAAELSHPQDDRGYTNSNFGAIAGTSEDEPLEPEAVDPDSIGTTTQDQLARRRFENQQGTHLLARRDKVRFNKLKDLRRKAQAKGIDTSQLDDTIDLEIAQLERALSDAA